MENGRLREELATVAEAVSSAMRPVGPGRTPSATTGAHDRHHARGPAVISGVAHPDARTPEEWVEDMRGADPSTPDDQSRTWDGRVLDTKEKMLEFLVELAEARRSGRSFHPDDNRA